jgi:hypothetical protein
MPKWKAARPGAAKKQQISKARQVGCIVWLVLAMAMVMWLFYAVFSAR